MLRFSTSNNKDTYSSNNLPPNPPLTSILEQCFWGERPDKYYYINKYNERCATRNAIKPIAKRPSSTAGRFFSSATGATTEKFPCINSMNDCSENIFESSRSSTPEFMQEVYDTYADLCSENLLLRRPVSRCDHQAEGDCSSVPNEDRSNHSSCMAIKDDFESAVRRLSPTEDGEKVCILPKLPPKTVKVDIDIPLWSNFEDVPTDTDIDLPAEKGDAKELIYDEDDADDIQSLKSSDSSRSRQSPIKKPVKIKKKKAKLRKKAEITTVSLDYMHNNSAKPIAKPSKNKQSTKNRKNSAADDDIVTQMSALGLSKRRDDELTPDMQRKNIAGRSNQRNILAKPSGNIYSFQRALVPSLTKAKTKDTRFKQRRIPIQIVSDPFMCNGSKVPEKKSYIKQTRPYTVGPLSTNRLNDAKNRLNL